MAQKQGATTNQIQGSREARLDEIDRGILLALSENARIPNNVLAKRVGIAPSTCLMRVRRLLDSDVIRGFHAELSPEAIGRSLQAIISVRLHTQARSRIGTFAAQYARLPGVLNVFFLTGDDDFQIHVALSSPNDLRQFVVQHLSASRDVAGTRTSLIFEHVTGQADPI